MPPMEGQENTAHGDVSKSVHVGDIDKGDMAFDARAERRL